MFWFVALSLFIFGRAEWFNIPNHNEEVFFSRYDTVSSIEDVSSKCQEIGAIPLVLYKPKVLDFVADLLRPG